MLPSRSPQTHLPRQTTGNSSQPQDRYSQGNHYGGLFEVPISQLRSYKLTTPLLSPILVSPPVLDLPHLSCTWVAQRQHCAFREYRANYYVWIASGSPGYCDRLVYPPSDHEAYDVHRQLNCLRISRACPCPYSGLYFSSFMPSHYLPLAQEVKV